MKEITCPNCHKAFQIDDAAYVEIVSQIKEAEIEKRVKDMERRHQEEKEHAIQQTKLESQLEQARALKSKDDEISELKGQLSIAKTEAELNEKSIRDTYEKQLELKDEQIAQYKDFKAKQSVKLLGESLEQHCQIEFEKLRQLGFQNAYFEKDNDAKTGSKGDFIFKHLDVDGTEILSIMFEMKNEADATATKKKNEDFFKELDKDRKEKNCEYAVLVSMLEPDSELYNMGIVDVSHKYEKMYVVRPQFFIPIITLLRNASQKSLEYKRAIVQYQQQHIDVTKFEGQLLDFQANFGKNYDSAKRHFISAIDEIDKTIKHLQEVKDNLTTSENQLRIANNKLQDLSIKKLTKDNPTMRAKFDALKDNQ